MKSSISGPRPPLRRIYKPPCLPRSQFLDDRRSRLTYLRPRIPGILWGVLIFGGAILLALTFLIGLESRLVQLIMTGALAAMIAISIVTIFDLESPLEGANHVNPTAWEIFAGPVTNAPR